jgi:glycosyltransferase involved in cell wall biosynthesis
MRILFCGDSPTVDTGFGVVAKNLLTRLEKMGHEIYAMGINHYGDNPHDIKQFNFPIWPVDKGSLDMMYGYQKFWFIEEQVKPDLIFFLNDPWVIEKYLSMRPATPDRYTKMIAYYPTDAGPMKPEWVKMLGELDAQVCYSNFAERVLIESNNNKRPKNLYQIYHGVDTNIFRPINQSEARIQLGIPVDAFVVGMVARNQYRKRFDILCKAFVEFAKDKPDAKLYLHTATHDVGWDIGDLVRQTGVIDDVQNRGRLILTQDITAARGVPADFLNVIYNSFDVNALISLGDGFGLPVAESMATACPQLVSGHSCLQELVEGHGGLTVKTAAWLMHTGGFNTWGGLSDVNDIVAKLNILYENKELRLQLAEQAYTYITQPQFSWDYAAAQFDKIIKKIFHVWEVKNGSTGQRLVNNSAA